MNSNRRWIQSLLCTGLAALLALSATSSRAGETITYIHWDALGSPVAATDESGNVVWRESYRPYGQRINNEAAAAPNSRWYTGHPQDPDTGLICAGARYYDPVVGRFLGTDSVGVQEGNLQSFNRYAYGNNNPYRYVDPDGKNGTEAIGGLFYESGQFLTGHGFDGARVWGALLDGYNGEGDGIAHAAFDDALNFAPGVGGLAAKAVLGARRIAGPIAKVVTISRSRYPEAAKHIEDAIVSGKPDILRVDRAGSRIRRREALRGTETKRGFDRDEFPPAMFEEGGQGASVRHINPSDNRGAGACAAAQCRGLPDGSRIRIGVGD